MKSSAAKIKIDSFDSLFGGGEPQGEQVRKIPLNKLHTFRGHPFRVLEDEKMQETVESVKKYGVAAHLFCLQVNLIDCHIINRYNDISLKKEKVPGHLLSP